MKPNHIFLIVVFCMLTLFNFFLINDNLLKNAFSHVFNTQNYNGSFGGFGGAGAGGDW